MTFSKNNDTFILRLAPGEELHTTLTKFCEQQQITGGWISGLGGARGIELASFDMATRQYTTQLFTGRIYEVTNFTGNIAVGKIHIHMTIGDHDFKAYAGHCNKAIADPTLEIMITPLQELRRELDDYCGLQLLALNETML